MRERPKLWEQQPGESSRAFEAFCAYRDLGEQRSLAKAADKLQKSRSMVEDWSRINGWTTRVAAYNTHQDRQHRKARRAEIMKMAERHAQIAALFQAKVIQGIQKLDANALQPADLIRFFEVSARVERESRRFGTHDVAQAAQDIEQLAEVVGVAPAQPAPGKKADKLNLADAIRGDSLSAIWSDTED